MESLILVALTYALGVAATALYELHRLKFTVITNFIFSSWIGFIIYLFTIECRRLYLWIINKLYL